MIGLPRSPTMSAAFPSPFPDFDAAMDDLPNDRQVAQLRVPPHSIEAERSEEHTSELQSQR